MSSSDDDLPLRVPRKMNSINTGAASKSKSQDIIPHRLDAAMDEKNKLSKGAPQGISIRNGPVEEVELHRSSKDHKSNGMTNGKRKSRTSLVNPKSYKDLTASSDEDDEPLTKRQRKSAKPTKASSDSEDIPIKVKIVSKKPSKVTAAAIGESEDSDIPLGIKLSNEKAQIETAAAKKAQEIRKGEKKVTSNGSKLKREASDEDDDIPIKKKRQSNGATPAKTNGIKKADSDDDVPLSKKSSKSSKVSAKSTPAKSSAKKVLEERKEKTKGKPKAEGKAKAKAREEDEAEAEEEEYRWWEAPRNDGTTKWTTLEHNGVIFPPPYQPLPKTVGMRYNGTPISMDPAAEEVAGFFGAMLNSTLNVENPTFQRNFFEDFTQSLKDTGGAKDSKGNKVDVKEFARCDFTPIFDHYEAQRLAKKNLSTAEKNALKVEKESAEADFAYCLWDGRKQKVGNFRVEPPGLFRGRGEHPKTGRLKHRVSPEQITINIGKGAKVPKAPPGHKWKEIRHDSEGTWLVMWQENINGAYKYVMLAANSNIKGQSDLNKFEKARELKKHIDIIRADYTKELRAEKMADRQRATAVYLIDKFALRAGNEKGEEEADTVGCCSLKFEHVNLRPPNTVIFDFLGKDSIRFYNEVEVDPQVFKNLKIFKKEPKGDGDEIFDRLTTTTLNKHLSGYMPGLTAKVFRTYNASFTMATLLKDMKSGGTIVEKFKDYNEANRKVAILCNHKRTVGANHGAQMEKMSDRIKGLKYQKWRVKQQMLQLEPKLKKKHDAAFFKLEDGLTEEWVEDHKKATVEEQRQKIEKKFQKDNEKLTAGGEKPMKQAELVERLEVVKEIEAKWKKEKKSGKVELEGKSPSVDKLEAQLVKLDERVQNASFQAEDKENNKEVALGTSKINYIDPRLTVVFSQKFNVPIEKLFTKTLREKFDWAIKSAGEDWEF